MLFNPRQTQINSDILEAATIIKNGGLCKNVLFDNKGRHCINGAIIAAIKGRNSFLCSHDPDFPRWESAVDRVAHSLGLGSHYYVPTWNNHPHRTKDEVVEALCQAAGVTSDVLV